MEKLSCGLMIPLTFLLLICCHLNLAEDSIDQIQQSEDSNKLGKQDSDNSFSADKRAGLATRDFVRTVLTALRNNYPDGIHYFDGRLGYGIPFRPVRRIGSEFLGKRSAENADMGTMDETDPFSLSKRARARMGSEFLGKRRLGSEFLGKRSQSRFTFESPDEYMEKGFSSFDMEPDVSSSESSPPVATFPISPSANGPQRFPEIQKRARMGSEFLGKRRISGPYDWAWKRGRLGSEFLGKRALGSEFLGK